MEYLTLALILFAVGVVLLLAEIFLPSGGILVVFSLLFFAIGVGIILTQGTTLEAVVAITALSIGLPTAFFFIVAAWRRMSIGMVPPDETTAPQAVPALAELETLKNRIGKTVSPMRPSGLVDFGGKRVDALTEGEMLDAGVWVRCVSVKSGKVIVRRLEAPPELEELGPPVSPPASETERPAPPSPQRPDRLDFDLDLDK